MAKADQPSRLTTEEADRIVEAAKSLAGTIDWRVVPKAKRPRWKFDVAIHCSATRRSVRLAGFNNGRTWSLSLLVDNHRVRCVGTHEGIHRNPDDSIATPNHKHRWTTEALWRETYEPDDIDFSSIDTALPCFLGECNIELPATYQPLCSTDGRAP